MVRLILLCWIAFIPLSICQADQAINNRSIAMLHMAPVLAVELTDLDTNTNRIIKAMRLAKAVGADWVLTPELALTGYKFRHQLGTDWIKPGIDRWTQKLQKTADDLDLVLLLSHLQEEPETGQSYNQIFVIDRDGEIIGRHRKINTLPGSEAWSVPGSAPAPIALEGISLGLLICADAWPADHAQSLAEQGAQLLLSSANWAPGLYGPGDSWEKRVAETGLALLVNNRTGIENDLDMRAAKSVVVVPTETGAQRIFEHQSVVDSIILLDFTISENRLVASETINF